MHEASPVSLARIGCAWLFQASLMSILWGWTNGNTSMPSSDDVTNQFRMTSHFVPPNVQPLFYTPPNENVESSTDSIILENKDNRPYGFYEAFYSEPPMSAEETYPSPNHVYESSTFQQQMTEFSQPESEKANSESDNENVDLEVVNICQPGDLMQVHICQQQVVGFNQPCPEIQKQPTSESEKETDELEIVDIVDKLGDAEVTPGDSQVAPGDSGASEPPSGDDAGGADGAAKGDTVVSWVHAESYNVFPYKDNTQQQQLSLLIFTAEPSQYSQLEQLSVMDILGTQLFYHYVLNLIVSRICFVQLVVLFTFYFNLRALPLVARDVA